MVCDWRGLVYSALNLSGIVNSLKSSQPPPPPPRSDHRKHPAARSLMVVVEEAVVVLQEWAGPLRAIEMA